MNADSDAIDTDEWQTVSHVAAMALTALSTWFIWAHFFTIEQWVLLLDHANLALHEAGHPLVGILSSHLSVYGGTFFQILFPLLFVRHFSHRRHTVGRAASLVWLGRKSHERGSLHERCARPAATFSGGTITIGLKFSAGGAFWPAMYALEIRCGCWACASCFTRSYKRGDDGSNSAL